MGTPQPPTLPPKPGEPKEEAQLCKIHSHAADIAATKRRQEEAKSSRSDDRKQPMAGKSIPLKCVSIMKKCFYSAHLSQQEGRGPVAQTSLFFIKK